MALAFMAALTGVAALLSGFMNNVGALALLMPVALTLSKKPSQILMPLSFGTILGGLTTLIGTPPNIIVSNYREQITGEPFGLFAFSPVGGVLAFVGLVFLLCIGTGSRISDTDSFKFSGGSFMLMDRRVVKELIDLCHAHDVQDVGGAGGACGGGDLLEVLHIPAQAPGHQRPRGPGVVEALAAAGLQPLELGPKEGLALINGTQFSTAFALAGLFGAWRAAQSALVTSALFSRALRTLLPVLSALRGPVLTYRRKRIKRSSLNRRWLAEEYCVRTACFTVYGSD